MISACCAWGRRMRRQRLRRAMAMAFLASSCPTMCWLRASTTCAGFRDTGSSQDREGTPRVLEEEGGDDGAFSTGLGGVTGVAAVLDKLRATDLPAARATWLYCEVRRCIAKGKWEMSCSTPLQLLSYTPPPLLPPLPPCVRVILHGTAFTDTATSVYYPLYTSPPPWLLLPVLPVSAKLSSRKPR